MKFYNFTIIVLLLSCADFFVPDSETFNSAVLQGNEWIQIENNMDDELFSNENSIQLFFNSLDVDSVNSPALLTIIDSNETTILGLFRDPGVNDSLYVYLDNEYIGGIGSSYLKLSNETFFMLTLVISQDISEGYVKVYLNDRKIGDFDKSISIFNNDLIIGAVSNREYSILSNYWYGLIDEVRLWDIALNSTIIKFHYNNPHKLTENTFDTWDNNNDLLISHLSGLWRFNTNEIETEFQDQKCEIKKNNVLNIDTTDCFKSMHTANFFSTESGQISFSPLGFSTVLPE